MNKYIGLILLSLSCSCSSSSHDRAIISANEIHEIAISEARIINTYCVSKYESSKTKEDIVAVDKICLPAQKSYHAVKSAWETLVLVIKNPEQNNVSQIEKSVLNLSRSLLELEQITDEMR